MPIACVKRKVAALSAPSNDDVMQKHEKRKKKKQKTKIVSHSCIVCFLAGTYAPVEECNANSVHGQLVAHMFMTSYKLERAVCILPKTDLPYVTSQFCDFRAGTCG